MYMRRTSFIHDALYWHEGEIWDEKKSIYANRYYLEYKEGRMHLILRLIFPENNIIIMLDPKKDRK